MDISVPLNPSNLFSANGLVVVITGGGSGIGHAIASALVQTGTPRIYILGRRLALADAASNLSDSVIPIECDVTSPTSVSAAVSRIDQEIGYIDVLINKAGMQGPIHRPANDAETIEELQSILLSNAEGWEATFAVNSSAVLYVSAAFLKLLDAGNRRRGWEGGSYLCSDRARRKEKGNLAKILIEPDDERTSQIITVGSISVLNRFITAGLAYSCSKAAAIHLCKMIVYLLAPWGIRSNVINPGVYPSVMTTGSKGSYNYKEVPAGRKDSFQDIAGVVLYLVGKGGAYVNGSMENTDGGRLSVMPVTY